MASAGGRRQAAGRSFCCLWAGKSRAGFVREGVEHYLGRIRHFHPIVEESVRAAGPSAGAAAAGLVREGQALLGRLRQEDQVVALDAQGMQYDSLGFARQLARWREDSRGRVVFLCGGAYGLAGPLKARAQSLLSLSSLTLPHQLVRLVLLEQIYRACTLAAGAPYHHA